MTRTTRTTALATAAAVLALAGCASNATTVQPGQSATQAPGTALPNPLQPTAATPSGAPTAAPYPTGSSGSPRATLPDPTQVNGQNADAVAEAALTVMYSMDTRIDTTPRNAVLRAVPYLTKAYATELAGSQVYAAPGAAWNDWAAHGAYTTATITPAPDSGAPTDTATTAYRSYTVTTTAHGTDSYMDTDQVGTAFVELTRSGWSSPWRVALVQIR